MTPIIFLLSVVLAPVIILTILKVDAALVFMSLCLGEVLVQYVSSDAISLITVFNSHASSISNATMKIILLLLPVILTTLIMFHSVNGAKVIVNILPSIAVGLLALVLLEPLLSSGTQGTIESSSAWQHFNQAQTLVVTGSALISLFFLWTRRRSGNNSSKKRHSKS